MWRLVGFNFYGGGLKFSFAVVLFLLVQVHIVTTIGKGITILKWEIKIILFMPHATHIYECFISLYILRISNIAHKLERRLEKASMLYISSQERSPKVLF